MKKYKKPDLVSYRSQDILEIVGPAQTQYTSTLDVGGGVEEAMLDKQAIEYRIASIPSEIRPSQVKAKTTEKRTV